MDSKKVEIKSLEARVDQATEALGQAAYDLERCTLWAPFTGEVSEVFIEAGGFARTAEPVAHLVMMDPIKVDVAVSAARATQLRQGDPVLLFPLAGGEVYGFIYEKSTAADPETRTFRVSVMVRNARVIAELAPDSPLRKLPRIEIYNRVQRLDLALPDSPLVVEERQALRQDDQGFFVWGTDELPRGQPLDPADPVLTFRKIRVVPSDERRNFQGLFVARALEDPGELTEDWIVAHDAPEDFGGGEMLIAIRDWQLRPGQIVPTLLGAEAPKPGRYVPMKALDKTAEGHRAVFIEQDGVARRDLVNVSEIVAELVRVEPAEPAGAALLEDGANVIVDFVHFLQDGEPVRVVQTRDLLP
jgi:multidrug efflux pump subunit AcrA (membrane-fusion protein)